MTITTELLRVDPKDIAQSLTDAREKLDRAECDAVLDFSTVQRIDPAVIRAMEDLAAASETKSVKIVLRGVNVDVYKVLKLARLAGRLTILD
jgi:anti-anti-sigma regulatory factor